MRKDQANQDSRNTITADICTFIQCMLLCPDLNSSQEKCLIESGRNCCALATCVGFITLAAMTNPALNFVGTTSGPMTGLLNGIIGGVIGAPLAYGLGGNLGSNGAMAALSTRKMIRERFNLAYFFPCCESNEPADEKSSPSNNAPMA